MSTPLRVAVAGNPNVGKTSLFNLLTKSRYKVGNYPGITVETREGQLRGGPEGLQLLLHRSVSPIQVVDAVHHGHAVGDERRAERDRARG